MLLMIPGPVHLHERIIRAMSRQMIGHRTRDFSDILDYCVSVLKKLFETKGDVAIISGSGTAGMESAIATFSNVKRITCIDNGKFGDRLGKIAERYVEDVDVVRFEWGSSIELEAVERSLSEGSEVLAFVHNETSTAILNPAEELCKLAKEYDALVIMDAITSVGGDVVEMDRWGVDVAIVGSQKCIGAPPGLCAVAVREKAWEFYNERCPFYLDLKAYVKKLKDSQTPYTPAVPLFFALEEALRIIEEEGLESRIKRHRKLSEFVRRWATESGLELFPKLNEYSSYSNTVTAIKMPNGVSDKELRGKLRERYDILVSGGQEHLKGKIFRIGTMGNVTERDVITTLACVERILTEKGVVKPVLADLSLG